MPAGSLRRWRADRACADLQRRRAADTRQRAGSRLSRPSVSSVSARRSSCCQKSAALAATASFTGDTEAAQALYPILAPFDDRECTNLEFATSGQLRTGSVSSR